MTAAGSTEEDAKVVLEDLGFEVVPASQLELVGWDVSYRSLWNDYASVSVWRDRASGRLSRTTEHVEPTAAGCWDWTRANAERREAESLDAEPCNDCGRPTFWDEERRDYRHVSREAPPCFLIRIAREEVGR